MFTNKFFRALILSLLFGAPLHAASYYGGALRNHGHSTAPGDGGPLTNPAFVGNITTTGTINAGNLSVSGTFNTTTFSASSVTISNLTNTAGINVNGVTYIEPQTFSSAAIYTTRGNALHANNTTGNIHLGSDLWIGVADAASATRRAVIIGNNSMVSWPPDYTTYASTPSIIIYMQNGAATSQGKTEIKGSIDGSDAPPGYRGEVIESKITVSSNVGTSAQYSDLTNIILSSGDWDISASVVYERNGATFSATDLDIGVTSTPGNSSAGLQSGYNYVFSTDVAPVAFTYFPVGIPSYRLVLTQTTTYYLKSYVGNYTVAVPKFTGHVTARRMR